MDATKGTRPSTSGWPRGHAQQVPGAPHAEQLPLREHLEKGAEQRCERLRRELVELEPLAEDAVGLEARPHGAIEVHGEQVVDAGNPWIRWLGDDEPVLV